YSGICIEYYSHRLLHALPSNVDLVHLGYGDMPPRIRARDAKEMQEAARKMFSQKKFNWAYEREWRALGPIGKVKLNGQNVVRSIYLGSRISDAHKKHILRALRTSRVRIYEMNVKRYAHKWGLIKHPPKKRTKTRAKRQTI